ncbi:MAG TPA: hypothetical protein VNH40_10600 [Gaiellaceae bacterium]|nr:hypothetical protein [Gaiellaceae bacterium]
MASFVVETYLPTGHLPVLAELAAEARQVARTGSQAGIAVRHVRSFLTPDDEMCFHVFEARSATDVARVVALGRLEHERITEVIE